MRATVNGYVTNLNLEVGDYELPGKPMFALIDSDLYYVNAYFEETKTHKSRSVRLSLFG